MAKYDLDIREEELKHKVARDWFANYDTTQIIDNIDFAVAIQPQGNELFKETEYLLWAEAKKGNKQNIYDSVVQLIFTIGKGRINEKHMPPKYIGAFDAEKIAFIPYNAIMEVFSQTDFNWNVPPSDHSTKEFLLLKTLVRNALEQSSLEDGNEAYRFDFVENRKELKTYISKNFKTDYKTNRGMRITHNNFVAIYNQWRKEVMPSISINWDKAKEHGLIDADFYLADLMCGKDNYTILQKLRVLLRRNEYMLKNGINYLGKYDTTPISFRDDMQAHKTFWARYARPPKEVYWDKIVDRRDLLVPQDVRERQGSYFTPAIWVEKSQEYLAEVLGENWQDEYYIWDCCAGTGNLLANLTNKYNIWASTLDRGDVQVMHERIAHMGEGSNLLDSHVFQFDFLNDDFSQLPQGLQDIIKDEEKRKKLVIYINPPYAEHPNAKETKGTGKNKAGVAKSHNTYKIYSEELGVAAREIYVQFLYHIYKKIPSCIISHFSTPKILNSQNFAIFRSCFMPKLLKLFVVPSNTFDNVNGKFPIGFYLWDTKEKDIFESINADVYDSNGNFIGKKNFSNVRKGKYIIDWLRQYYDKENDLVAFLHLQGTDIEHNNYIHFTTTPSQNAIKEKLLTNITHKNLIPMGIYLTLRNVINSYWLNNKDQYLWPRIKWKDDQEFQYDCLAFALFCGQNKISSKGNLVNHWIPFTEDELQAPDKFQSHFMSNFIAGKCKNRDSQQELEYAKKESLIPTEPIQFSPEAQAVMDAGRELWYYYMHHKDGELYGAQSINVNASYYDIRRYFQGETNGKMNTDSKDETYMRLWGNIKDALKVLAKKIEPKVYLYGFLLDETTLPEDEPSEVVIPEKKPVKTVKIKTPHKSEQKMVVHYHINAENISLQTDGTINIGEINDK